MDSSQNGIWPLDTKLSDMSEFTQYKIIKCVIYCMYSDAFFPYIVFGFYSAIKKYDKVSDWFNTNLLSHSSVGQKSNLVLNKL